MYTFLKSSIKGLNTLSQGCYADYSNKRDIILTYTNNPSGLTIEYCIEICLNTGYKVAGLQKYDSNL